MKNNAYTSAPEADSGAAAAVKPRKKESFWYGLGAKGYFDITYFSLIIVLLALGLVMLYSASNVYALQHEGNSAYYVTRQLVFAVIGLVAMWFISNINYNKMRRFTKWLYIAGLVLLVITLFMPARSGAHRWIFIGSSGFQPSELVKLFMIIIYAKIFALYDEKRTMWTSGQRFAKGVVFPIILLMPVLYLLYKEPHMSAMVLFVAITGIMMWVGGVGWGYFAAVFGSIAAALAGLVLSGNVQYMTDRVSYWIDPWSDALGKGYQVIQSLYAIGSGGLWGRGLGNSLQKHLYIPEPQNDFVFSVVCEEFGFIGALVVIALFVALILRGLKIAFRAKDKFGTLLVVGITAQVGLQALLNIAVVTNTVPNTGISLPFFSSGGTALTLMLAEMGIVLSVSRSSSIDNAT